MKLYLILLAICCCIPLSVTFPSATKSEQLFAAIPAILGQHLDENQEIDSLLDNLEEIDNPPKKVAALINELISQDNKWKTINEEDRATYTYLAAHINQYKTSQSGIYDLPADKIGTIFAHGPIITSILQSFQKILTQLNGGNSQSLSGLSGLLLPSANSDVTTQINELEVAASKIQGWIGQFQAGKTIGSKTAINLTSLMNALFQVEANLPNYYEVMKLVITQILRTLTLNAL